MSEEFLWLLPFIVIPVALVGIPTTIWFISRRYDRTRVQQHLAQQGAKLEWIELDFPGSLRPPYGVLDKHDRRFEICYRDDRGREIRQWCRFIANEPYLGPTRQITPFGPLEPEDEAAFLRRENEELREGIKRLYREAEF